MAPLLSLATLLFALHHAAGHFTMNTPASAGFDDAQEAVGPCGGFNVDHTKSDTKTTDFHVEGDAVSVRNGHPSATFLFRVTTSEKAETANWTTLMQPIQQTGIGDYCAPTVAVPSDYAGKKGILQVIADSPDGMLYQCCALNFVSGMGSTQASDKCKNATGVSASYTDDKKLTDLPSMTNSSSSSTNTTSGGAKSSSAAAGRTVVRPLENGLLGSMVWMALVAVGTAGLRML